MKKILLFSFLSFFTFSALSAQVAIVNNILIASGTLDNTDINVYTDFMNETQNTLNLRWERTIISQPAEWLSYICTTPGNCGVPTTNSLSFDLITDTIGVFQCHINPNGVPGYGEILVTFINEANEEPVAEITVILDLMATGVSTNELRKTNIQLFPNPTSDYFSLSNGEHIDQINVYNVLGQKVKASNNTNSNFWVGDLKKGLYLVQVIDKSTNTSQTLRLKKE